jgi:hypothetical protein
VDTEIVVSINGDGATDVAIRIVVVLLHGTYKEESDLLSISRSKP